MKRFVSILPVCLLALLFLVPTAQAKKKKKGQYSVKAKITLEAGADLVVDVEGDLAPCAEWHCHLYVTAPKKPASKEATLIVMVRNDGRYHLRTKKAPAEGDEAKKKAMKKKAKEKKGKKGDDEASETYTTDGGVSLQVKKAPKNICDPIELAEYTEYSKKAAEEGKAPADDSWKQLPVLTYDERLACKRRGQPIKTYEFDEFAEGDPLAKADEDDDSGDAAADSGAEDEKSDEDKDDKSDEPKFDKSDAQLESIEGGRQLTISASSLPEGDFDLSVNGYWGATVDGTKIGSAAMTGVIRVRR